MLKSENMMGIASDLKGLEEKQLMQMAKSPDTSSAPPFLVIAELQRRKRDKAMNAGPAPTTTVKDDTLAAAAGVPQGGISGLARAMNPQMAQPGQMPTMKMAEGSRGPIPPRPSGPGMISAQAWWDKLYGGPPTANPNLPAYLRNPTPEGSPRLPARDQFPNLYSRGPKMTEKESARGDAPGPRVPAVPPAGGSPMVPGRDQFPNRYNAQSTLAGAQLPSMGMPAGEASPRVPGVDQFPNRYSGQSMPAAKPGGTFDLTTQPDPEGRPNLGFGEMNPLMPSLGYGDTSSLPAWKQPGRSEDAIEEARKKRLLTGAYSNGPGNPPTWEDYDKIFRPVDEALGFVPSEKGSIFASPDGREPQTFIEGLGAGVRTAKDALTYNPFPTVDELVDPLKQPVRESWAEFLTGLTGKEMVYGGEKPESGGGEGSTEAEKAQPEPLSEEEQEEVKTRIKETLLGGGGGGGAGGGVGGAAVPKSDKLSDLEAALRKEKWMALARFGFALMSSDKPTMGQAMGDAGMYMMDALQAAQDRYQQLKATEEELMLRRMAAASRGNGAGGSSALDKVAMREEYQNWRDVAYQIRQSMVGMKKGDKGYDQLYNELTFAQNKANEARMMLSMIGAMPPTDLAGGMPGGGNYDARAAG